VSGNWETGLGTFSTTGPTLTRTTISASSNAGSAVTFSGTVNVFVTYIAAKSVILDASGNATISGTMTASSFTASSDERLKENWRDLPDTFINDLAEVKHGSYNRIGNEWREAGVSAQSLMEVLPETVIADEKGMLSVNYGATALVAAIELAKEIKVLRAEIAKLKAK
jgi:hypothetical protein